MENVHSRNLKKKTNFEIAEMIKFPKIVYIIKFSNARKW